MSQAEEYREYAAICARIARSSAVPEDKVTLLEMAQRWRELADKVEREARK